MAALLGSMRGAVVLAVVIYLASSCSAPFGLGEPASRQLEQGVAGSLSATSGFEVTGSYTEAGVRWAIDLQTSRTGDQHVLLNGGTEQLEAIVTPGKAYFRGQKFLAAHLGTDAVSQNLASVAGTSWWTSASASVPRMPDLLDGSAFRATFLGSAVARRTDHVVIDGVDSVDLSGQRADVYVAEAPPHRLVHLRTRPGVVIDGAAGADLHYGSYDRDFNISAPTDVIDFSNLSTLPPVYTVISVDTSQCGSPCVVSAQLKNLGGATGARAASTVTFTMSDAASGAVLAGCSVLVSPDVGYNATTKVTCTFAPVAGQQNAAVVTATATNPGRA